MSEVLFIAHRIPFPPDRGDKIRSHHVLRHIAALAPVHVATLAEDSPDLAQEAELAKLAASFRIVRRPKPLPLAGLEALATRRPVSVAAFHSPALQAYVRQILATRPISAIYVFSGQMGHYVPADCAGRVVMDFVDVDSAKFDAYAEGGNWPKRWIDGREGRMLRAEEARLAARADVSLLISREERELFLSRLPRDVRSCANVAVMRNGIDSALFAPDAVQAEPRMSAIAGPKLIFTGQMDYAPNIDAAQRAIGAILPLVRETVPDATLHVVGRNPPASLLGRHGRDGVFVWGGVPDMRPWLKAADLALVPLNIARGVQNKVLEAMAMELPTVLSHGAATGIDARNDQDFCIRDSDRDMAQAIVALLQEPHRARDMAARARQFVVRNADWNAALAPLAEWLGLTERAARNAA